MLLAAMKVALRVRMGATTFADAMVWGLTYCFTSPPFNQKPNSYALLAPTRTLLQSEVLQEIVLRRYIEAVLRSVPFDFLLQGFPHIDGLSGGGWGVVRELELVFTLYFIFLLLLYYYFLHTKRPLRRLTLLASSGCP